MTSWFQGVFSEDKKPRHHDSKTKKPRHRDSKAKKPRHRVPVEFWPLRPLIGVYVLWFRASTYFRFWSKTYTKRYTNNSLVSREKNNFFLPWNDWWRALDFRICSGKTLFAFYFDQKLAQSVAQITGLCTITWRVFSDIASSYYYRPGKVTERVTSRVGQRASLKQIKRNLKKPNPNPNP